jgi:uncharacterized protein YbjQ (UPF0145 family)
MKTPEVAWNNALITTGFDLAGYRVTRSLGLVRGLVVRSRSIFGTIGAAVQTLFGGNITLYTELCEKAREDAYRLMIEQAESLGANAIIGVRYDANEVTSGVTEVLAYGTAVIAVPETLTHNVPSERRSGLDQFVPERN